MDAHPELMDFTGSSMLELGVGPGCGCWFLVVLGVKHWVLLSVGCCQLWVLGVWLVDVVLGVRFWLVLGAAEYWFVAVGCWLLVIGC